MILSPPIEALERRGRVQGLDLAVVDDGDAVAVLGLVHVVGGHEDGDADLVAQRADVLPDGVARLRVEPDGRLVEEEHLGVVQQPAGDLQPALHAAGEGAHERMAPVGQPDDVEHVLDALLADAARDVVEHGVELQVLIGREPVVERGVLEDHADRLPHAGRLGGDVVAGQLGPAAGRPEQGREHVDGRALAGAVRAEEAEDLALVDLEIDGIDGPEGAEVLAEFRHHDHRLLAAQGYPPSFTDVMVTEPYASASLKMVTSSSGVCIPSTYSSG